MNAPRRSLFGPLALIGLGVLLLVHNLVRDYSFWTPVLDHWPWFLVAWGALHVVQHLVARANGSPGPRRLKGGAVFVALLICLGGATGRAVRSNDGVVFRGFGVRLQLRDPAFRLPAPGARPASAAPHEIP